LINLKTIQNQKESRQLDDADFPLLISGKLGKEESLYRFVVRPRVDMGYVIFFFFH